MFVCICVYVHVYAYMYVYERSLNVCYSALLCFIHTVGLPGNSPQLSILASQRWSLSLWSAV